MKLLRFSIENSQKKQQGIATLTAFLFLGLLAAFAAIAILYFQGQRELVRLEDTLTQLQTQLSVEQATVGQFKETIERLNTDSISQDAVVKDQLKRVDETLTTVAERLGKMETNASQEWLLAEVDYLLRIADHRIIMKEDVKGAVKLLESAEKVIQKIPVEDSGLHDVRIAIAKDVTQLQSFKAIDLPGTYAQLVALGDFIDTLPMVSLESEASAPGAHHVSDDNEWSVIEKINQLMGDFLTIRRYNNDQITQMLTHDQKAQLKDALRLSLEKAEMALLRGDQVVYDSNLQRVQQAFSLHFKADDYQVDVAKLKLENLMDIEIEKDLPSIAQSQQALKHYLSSRNLAK